MNAMSKIHHLFVKHLRTMYAGEKSMIDAFQLMKIDAVEDSLRKFYEAKAEEHLSVLSSIRKVLQMLGVSPDGEVDHVIDSVLRTCHSDDLAENSKHQAIALCGKTMSIYRINGIKTAISSAEDLGAFDEAEILEATLSMVKFNSRDFEFLKMKFENAGIEATEFEAA